MKYTKTCWHFDNKKFSPHSSHSQNSFLLHSFKLNEPRYLAVFPPSFANVSFFKTKEKHQSQTHTQSRMNAIILHQTKVFIFFMIFSFSFQHFNAIVNV